MSQMQINLQKRNMHNEYNPFDLVPETPSTFPKVPCRYINIYKNYKTYINNTYKNNNYIIYLKKNVMKYHKTFINKS